MTSTIGKVIQCCYCCALLPMCMEGNSTRVEGNGNYQLEVTEKNQTPFLPSRLIDRVNSTHEPP